VCVSAEQAKDHEEHFPINGENQARNALSEVAKYDSVPPWYNGSLAGLQALVSRKVHSKYPSIGKEKKSSVDSLIDKYSQSVMPQNLMPHNHTQSNLTSARPNDTPDDPNDQNGNGVGTRQPQSPAKPTIPFDPKVKQLQTILHYTYKLTGKDGKPLQMDGKMGNNTRFALQSFKTEYGMPQAIDAVAMERVLRTESDGKPQSTYGGKEQQAPAGQTLPTAEPTRPNIPEVNAIVDAIKNGRQWLETATAGGISPQQLPQMIQVSQNLKQLATQLWNSQGQAGKTLYDQANKLAQDIWTQAENKNRPANKPHRKHPQQPAQPIAQPATASAIENLITKYSTPFNQPSNLAPTDPELKIATDLIAKARALASQPGASVQQYDQMLQELYNFVPVLETNKERAQSLIDQVKAVAKTLYTKSGRSVSL
jgi:hypothetical protein